jgi:hypothetical protein
MYDIVDLLHLVMTYRTLMYQRSIHPSMHSLATLLYLIQRPVGEFTMLSHLMAWVHSFLWYIAIPAHIIIVSHHIIMSCFEPYYLCYRGLWQDLQHQHEVSHHVHMVGIDVQIQLLHPIYSMTMPLLISTSMTITFEMEHSKRRMRRMITNSDRHQ